MIAIGKVEVWVRDRYFELTKRRIKYTTNQKQATQKLDTSGSSKLEVLGSPRTPGSMNQLETHTLSEFPYEPSQMGDKSDCYSKQAHPDIDQDSLQSKQDLDFLRHQDEKNELNRIPIMKKHLDEHHKLKSSHNLEGSQTPVGREVFLKTHKHEYANFKEALNFKGNRGSKPNIQIVVRGVGEADPQKDIKRDSIALPSDAEEEKHNHRSPKPNRSSRVIKFERKPTIKQSENGYKFLPGLTPGYDADRYQESGRKPVVKGIRFSFLPFNTVVHHF